MSEDWSNQPEAAVVADAVRRAASPDVTPKLGAPDYVAVRVLREDERIDVEDLERLADGPREKRGGAVVHQAPSFVTYVNRHANAATTLWANPANGHGRVVALFDDHLPGSDESTAAGWREHTCEFQAQLDPDWADWIGINGRLMGQKDFAQFLRDHDHTITRPAPNRLMPAVLQFQAARNAKYESSVNLDNGQVSLVYVEDIKTTNQRGRQTVSLDEEIELALFPYLGASEATQAWPVTARIQWSIPPEGGELKIGVRLVRPDQIQREAWDRLCADIVEGLNPVGDGERPPLLQGIAPSALRNRPLL